MRYVAFFLIGVCLYVPGALRSELINKPVANIYLQPEEDTEVDSQAIYGESIEVIEQLPGWSKIKMADGVEGWVPSSQIVSNPSFEKNDHLRPVKNLFAHIYRVTDTTPFPPLLTLPYGSKVKLDQTIDAGERWVRVELISGEKAWIQRGDIDFSPRLKTLEEVLSFSNKFLGLPYTWGGASSYGFDCSGFVQMLFKEMGLLLPRNASDQAECGLFMSVTEDNLQPGDVLFFGALRITHVGLYLGGGDFIHFTVVDNPIAMISDLQDWKPRLLAARRIDPLMIDSYRINCR